jgi:hypothetical protein
MMLAAKCSDYAAVFATKSPSGLHSPAPAGFVQEIETITAPSPFLA